MKFYTYFSRQQRLAVVLLTLIIISLELMLVLRKSSPSESHKIEPETYLKFQNEMDSLIVHKLDKSTPKIYPFNPNYITDYKGYTLGMSAPVLRFRSFLEWERILWNASIASILLSDALFRDFINKVFVV